MQLNQAFSKLIGIVGALMVPAVVVAQFTPGTVLTADGLNARVVRVGATALVASLQADVASGAIAPRTFTSRGDGIVNIVPAGGGVIFTQSDVRSNGFFLGRAPNGGSLTLAVREGQEFIVEGFVANNRAGQLDVFWTSLRGDAAPPR